MNKKEIVKQINGMSGKYSPYDIFADWVEMMALSIQNACDFSENEVWEKREQRFKTIRKKYTDSEFSKMREMLVLLGGALSRKVHDALGEIYMESMNGNKGTGQYFTPFNCCLLTAKTVIPDNYDGGKKLQVYEPTSGGGGLVIAVASILQERGFNYQQCMDVVSQDLDWKAVYMTYVQLSLLGISAEVVQGDVLQEPFIKRNYPPERVLRTPRKMGVLL